MNNKKEAIFYFRSADFLLPKIEKWNEGFQAGGELSIRALKEFDREIHQINRLIEWLKSNYKDSLKAAGIMSKLPRIGGRIFNLRYGTSKYIELLELAADASRMVNELDLEALHIGTVGNCYLFLGKYRLAIEHFDKGINKIKALENPKLERPKVAFIGNIGVAYMSLGDINEAIKYFEEALEAANNINDIELAIFPKQNLSISYKKIGKLEVALKYAEETLLLAEQLKDIQRQGHALNSLGNIYLELQDFPKALDYLQKSLVKKRTINDIPSISNTLLNIGIVYSEMNKLDEAMDAIEQGIKNLQKLGASVDERILSKLIGHKAQVLAEMGKYEQAIEAHSEEIILVKKVDDKFGEVFSNLNLGKVLSKTGKLPEAIKKLDYAHQLAKQISDVRSIGASAFELSKIYFKLGDVDKALNYCEEGIKVTSEFGDSSVAERLLSFRNQIIKNK